MSVRFVVGMKGARGAGVGFEKMALVTVTSSSVISVPAYMIGGARLFLVACCRLPLP